MPQKPEPVDELTALADWIARGRDFGHFVPLSIRSLPSVAAAIERRTAARKRTQARERAEYEGEMS